MKKALIAGLQTALVLHGIGVAAALLVEPWFEGVNASATSFTQIYFDDPFLLFVYVLTIPFFVGLYHAIKVLGFAARNQTSSPGAIHAVATIKRCALITAATIVAVDAYLMIIARNTGEDAAGAIALGMIATIASLVVAAAAALYGRRLQRPLST